MFIHVDKSFVVCFSDKTDGSLDFYNMPAQLQQEIWSKLISKINIGFNLQFPRFLRQVHKTDLVYISEQSNLGLAGDGDALYTDQKFLPIGVFTADCQPILAASNGVVVAIHSGWRGAMQKIAYKTLSYLIKNNVIDIFKVKIYLGACIGSCCLEVGEEVYFQFIESDPMNKTFFSFKGERYNLDLRALNTFQILEAGIDKSQIFHILDCTKCMSEKYFSYRGLKNRSFSQFSWIANI